MRGCIGWLILLPFAGAIWLAYKIADACIKKGGPMRLLGVLVCLLVGGGSIYAGYHIGPIVGWFIMAIGGLVAIVGTWRNLVVTKEQVEAEELSEKLDKERKTWEQELARERAKEILEQGEIDDYQDVDWICNVLTGNRYDSESAELLERLKSFIKNKTKKERRTKGAEWDNKRLT